MMKKIIYSQNHTLIINKICKIIEFHNWDLIFSFLPNESFSWWFYKRYYLRRMMEEDIDIDIVVPLDAIEIGKKISNNLNVKLIILDRKEW